MFTCHRARQVWHSDTILDVIDSVTSIDRLGSVILEEILRNQKPHVPSLGQIGFREAIAVRSWYIWWLTREAVKGEQVASPARSAFSIMGLATNYKGSHLGKKPRDMTWVKPDNHPYKVNIDASLLLMVLELSVL